MLSPEIVFISDLLCTALIITIVVYLYKLRRIIQGRVMAIFLVSYLVVIFLRGMAIFGYANEARGWYIFVYILLACGWIKLYRQIVGFIHLPSGALKDLKVLEVYRKDEEAPGKPEE